MNKSRRMILKGASDELKEMSKKLESIKSEVEYVRNEEERSYENLPENFQFGEQGDALMENTEELEEICNELYSLIDEFNCDLIGFIDSYDDVISCM